MKEILRIATALIVERGGVALVLCALASTAHGGYVTNQSGVIFGYEDLLIVREDRFGPDRYVGF